VSPVATEANCVNIAPPLSELFAVCDTVHHLSTLKSYESMIIKKLAETVVNPTCDNAETVVHTESVTENH
jgi:hypothetical protein